jgi:hypothetical protein
MKQKFTLVALTVFVMFFLLTRGSAAKQHEQQSPPSMKGMNMGQDPSPEASDESMNAATQMMSSHHMDMGPHMKMTALRQPSPGHQERARKIVAQAREVMSKYQDYHAALADGFEIFLPNVPQQQYHFTNYRYGFEAGFSFNPEHPTSLLYDKTGDGYKLAGVMYTASNKASEDELNARIPLSVAQWHEHVNFCFPPKGRESEAWQKNPKFGMAGSISTKESCDQAGGRFVPLIFGWMVHIYPYEKNPADIWAMGPGMEH